MSAHDIVGEDLQLRLLIHLRPRRQENGLGFHRPIGLLRRFLDDNLSLKHADRVVIDDRAIEFAADPSGRGMNDLQRRIGAPRAVDKRQSAKRQLGFLSSHSDKDLPARQVAAGNQSKGPKLRGPRQFADLRFDVQPGLVPDDRHMLRPGAVRERHDRRCDVAGRPHERRRISPRTRPARRRRARWPSANKPSGTRPCRKMQERDRLGELCLARDGNCAPRGAHRFVESRQGIVDRSSGDRALRDGDPGREAIRKFGDEASAQEDKLRPGREALASGDPAPRRIDVGARGR